MDAVTNVPSPANEPVRSYAPGSPERAALESKVKELGGERAELTMTIGGRERTGGGEPVDVVAPHNHRHVLGTLRNATDEDVAAAIGAAAAGGSPPATSRARSSCSSRRGSSRGPRRSTPWSRRPRSSTATRSSSS